MNDNERRELEQKAKNRDVNAAKTLGNYYRQLEETEENNVLSHYYYMMAANLGYAPAKFMVALDYIGGDGVEANLEIAFKYMKEAADEGVANAQYMYALSLMSDKFKSKEAFTYFERAAKQGQARAQVELGDIYMFQKQEIDNAIFWWVCAYLHGESALQDSNNAKERLDDLVKSGVPGGQGRISRMMETVKESRYSQYRQNPSYD